MKINSFAVSNSFLSKSFASNTIIIHLKTLNWFYFKIFHVKINDKHHYKHHYKYHYKHHLFNYDSTPENNLTLENYSIKHSTQSIIIQVKSLKSINGQIKFTILALIFGVYVLSHLNVISFDFAQLIHLNCNLNFAQIKRFIFVSLLVSQWQVSISLVFL